MIYLALILHAGPPPALTSAQVKARAARNDVVQQGFLAHQAGRVADAARLIERAASMDRDLVGPHHRALNQSLTLLGDLYQGLGDWPRAAERRRELAAAIGRLWGERHWRAADARWWAVTTRQLGELPEATRRRLAVVPDEQVNGLIRAGKADEALALRRRAVDACRELLGEVHPHHGRALYNLAFTLRRAGFWREAIRPGRDAVATLSRIHESGGHPDLGNAELLLAEVLLEIGDTAGAIDHFQRAASILRATRGYDHLDHARSLLGLGSLLSDLGGTKPALPLLEEALRIASLHESGTSLGAYVNALAQTTALLGDKKAAETLYLRSLAAIRRGPGEASHHYPRNLHNLATLYLSMPGRHDEALGLFTEAAGRIRLSHGPANRQLATIFNNAAQIHLGRGRDSAAIVMLEQSLAVARAELARAADFQSERQQMATLVALRHALDLRLGTRDDGPASSHAHALSWKGAAFDAQRRRRLAARDSADPALRALAVEMREAVRALAALAALPDPPRREVFRLTQEREVIEARLAEKSAAHRDAVRRLSSDAVRDALPGGAALVDFFIYGGNDPGRILSGERHEFRLCAWILRRGRPTVRLDFGPFDRLTTWIDELRADVDSGGDGAAAGAWLRRTLWLPVERHLDGARLVLVSPDGPIGRLPFAALPGRRIGSYLIEEMSLACVPIPRLLTAPPGPAPAGPLLAVGGVDHGAPWRPLPATLPEADAVRAAFVGESRLLSGKAATPAALQAALPKARFAHLATHGFFDERRGRLGMHPGLVSGIVLAGGSLTALEVSELDLSNMELSTMSACETGLGKVAEAEGTLGLQRAFQMAGCRSIVSSLWSVNDAATAVLMDRFHHHLWGGKRLPKAEAMRLAQIEVMRNPEWVEDRVKKLRGVAGLRGVGKASERIVSGTSVRRSPPAWWAAWQLSGDWR